VLKLPARNKRAAAFGRNRKAYVRTEMRVKQESLRAWLRQAAAFEVLEIGGNRGITSLAGCFEILALRPARRAVAGATQQRLGRSFRNFPVHVLLKDTVERGAAQQN